MGIARPRLEIERGTKCRQPWSFLSGEFDYQALRLALASVDLGERHDSARNGESEGELLPMGLQELLDWVAIGRSGCAAGVGSGSQRC